MPREEERFIRNRLKNKPVRYTVKIKHFVQDGEWVMSVQVNDVSEDAENRFRVAGDLRAAADLLDDAANPIKFRRR